MCKIIYDEETTRNLINAFFSPIDSLKSTLENLCDYNRHGIAYGSDCTLRLSSWYANDEKNSMDYIGDGNNPKSSNRRGNRGLLEYAQSFRQTASR